MLMAFGRDRIYLVFSGIYAGRPIESRPRQRGEPLQSGKPLGQTEECVGGQRRDRDEFEIVDDSSF